MTAASGGPPRLQHPLAHPLAAELEQLARQAAALASLELVGLQVLTHRIPMTVQVFVRRADGGDVSLDDCAAFSAPLGEALEAAGLLADSAYVLEVSSPGIGEQLQTDRDFASFRGFPVTVELRDGEGARSSREGLLLGRDAQAVLLNVRGRSLRLARDAVLQVRLTTPGDAS